jgi:hypothetical protein
MCGHMSVYMSMALSYEVARRYRVTSMIGELLLCVSDASPKPVRCVSGAQVEGNLLAT